MFVCRISSGRWNWPSSFESFAHSWHDPHGPAVCARDTTMNKQIVNFSPGPSKLPEDVSYQQETE